MTGMKVEWEDNMSEYLNKLEELAQDKTNTTNFLKDILNEAHTEHIAPKMPQWNPNLINSPMEPEHQTVEIEEGKSSIELLYTGFTHKERTEGLDLVFWEFAVDYKKSSRHLARDYAYFQETGDDDFVSAVSPRYQPQHLHFVQEGIEEYTPITRERMSEYVQKLLHLEKWQRKTQPWHIEDWDSYG